MGTPEFALPSLRVLLENKYPLVGVVTAPDKPRGRGQHVAPAAVKHFALDHSLRIFQPEDLKEPRFLSDVKSLSPDLIVVVAFRILPPEVYSLAGKGAFNLHASLLPKYRGAAPINWAILKGEHETGVTTFFLEEKVDTGSIILQARVRINPDETAGELHDKLAEVGGEIVLQTVRLIEQGKAHPRPQRDELASPAPKIFRKDCRIPWTDTSATIHNFVRGLSPSPGAWTMFGETLIRIYRTRPGPSSGTPSQHSLPGTVVSVDEETLVVRSSDGIIFVQELQQEGRKRMSAAEFLRGFPVKAGDRFE